MKIESMSFMNNEIMEKLIDDLCEYDADAWNTISFQLNLYGKLTTRIANPNSQPPILVMKELFMLMKEQDTPIDSYRAAVQKACPAALSRRNHAEYITSYVAEMPKIKVSQPAPKCIMLGKTSILLSVLQESVVLLLVEELLQHGITMYAIKLLLSESAFNSFTSKVVNYDFQSTKQQLIEFMKYLRVNAFTTSEYRWIVEQCYHGALVVNETQHAKLFANVVPTKPSFALLKSF